MSYLVRGISSNKNARLICVDAKDVVQKAQDLHDCSGTAIAALGRVLIGTIMLGENLKGENEKLTLHVASHGIVKSILATINSKGEVKGYISNPFADLPQNTLGKLDVSGIIGKGELRVIKDLGMKDPYVGVVPLTSGEIGEDLAYYLFSSEQIPSVVGVGVLVASDRSIKQAGGFIIQLLPDASEEFIAKLEEKVKDLKSVTDLLDKNMSPEDILKNIMDGVEEVQILEKKEVSFVCNCNKDNFYRGLLTLGKDDLIEMFEEKPHIETECHFCRAKYSFVKEDFAEVIA